jgi:glucose-1-phosphatase
LNHPEIQTIILDLGGVIINLDIDHAFDRFSQLFGKDIRSDLLHDLDNHRFFLDYELGHITDDTFRNHLNSIAQKKMDDHELDSAWNAMLSDIPVDRMNWINELTSQYKVVILSNTNAIHIRRFDEVFAEANNGKFPNDIFYKTYYSHLIHDRKPNESCFTMVLDDLNADPSKTVFYDDNLDNITTAQSLGIHAVLVEKNKLRKDQLPNGRK